MYRKRKRKSKNRRMEKKYQERTSAISSAGNEANISSPTLGMLVAIDPKPKRRRKEKNRKEEKKREKTEREIEKR